MAQEINEAADALWSSKGKSHGEWVGELTAHLTSRFEMRDAVLSCCSQVAMAGELR